MNKYNLCRIIGYLFFVLVLASILSAIWLGITSIEGMPATEIQGDDYDDAPSEIKDGTLDYQDYQKAGCPHLDQTLDQRVMKQCNQWVRENNITVD